MSNSGRSSFLPSNLDVQLQEQYRKMNESFTAQFHQDRASRQAVQKRQEELAGRFDARDILEYLSDRISRFESSLGQAEEIGLQLANFGLATQIHIRSISFRNPNLIEFHGVDLQNQATILVQHISQLNLMLIAMKPIEEVPYRIGFSLNGQE